MNCFNALTSLFQLVCDVLVCVCVYFLMCGFVYLWIFNVWLCVWLGFVMSGCFDKCVGILLICVLVFTAFSVVKLCCILLRLYIFIIIISFFCTNIKITATK